MHKKIYNRAAHYQLIGQINNLDNFLKYFTEIVDEVKNRDILYRLNIKGNFIILAPSYIGEQILNKAKSKIASSHSCIRKIKDNPGQELTGLYTGRNVVFLKRKDNNEAACIVREDIAIKYLGNIFSEPPDKYANQKITLPVPPGAEKVTIEMGPHGKPRAIFFDGKEHLSL